MSNPLPIEELAQKIVAFVRRPQPLLFAGAGVGVHAGLPDWYQYLNHLVIVAERYEPQTAQLMRLRVDQQLLSEAVSLYKRCPVIPDAESFAELAAPFGPACYQSDKLHALVALPFAAIATTNYDRSLHDAYAVVHKKAPLSAELADPTLRHAIYNWNTFYIARIHGRAEVPRSIVASTEDYAQTEVDSDYTGFLFHVLTRTSCLFVGYSFLDPAIQRVLRAIRDRIGMVPSKHAALLPSNATKLAVELAKYSIELWPYDAANSHESLWKSFRRALSDVAAKPPPQPERYPEPLDIARRLLACCYARLMMRSSVQSLRHIVAEGITLSLLVESGPSTTSALGESLRRFMPLTKAEAEGMVRENLSALAEKDWVAEEDGTVRLTHPIDNQLDLELELLLKSVADRLLVREGYTATDGDRRLLRDVIEEVVLLRGWDMGANFAAGRPPHADLMSLLRVVLERRGGGVGPAVREKLASACFDLFHHPNTTEAKLLVSLGRLAFGVELALGQGRTSLLHESTLPERIYLDASVLMPAVIKGHPYQPTYVAAMKRLQQAQYRIGRVTKVLVLQDFLNEIISHRARAIEIVRQEGLEDRGLLERYVLYRGGLENCNVFVGAYAGRVGRQGAPVSFADFLHKEAPYTNEEALGKFIQKRFGIESIGSTKTKPDRTTTLYGELRASYLADSGGYETKPTVLIKHEAEQLAWLDEDRRANIRAVFVTADDRLRRVAVGDVLGTVGSALISNFGLIELIDLLIGIEARPESLARVLWAVEACDERAQLRNYFVDLALRHYEPAEAKAMNSILDDIVDEVRREARSAGIGLDGRDDQIDGALKLLDRFEDRFFATMADLIRKQQGSS
jgi:SIR2-like domain